MQKNGYTYSGRGKRDSPANDGQEVPEWCHTVLADSERRQALRAVARILQCVCRTRCREDFAVTAVGNDGKRHPNDGTSQSSAHTTLTTTHNAHSRRITPQRLDNTSEAAS